MHSKIVGCSKFNQKRLNCSYKSLDCLPLPTLLFESVIGNMQGVGFNIPSICCICWASLQAAELAAVAGPQKPSLHAPPSYMHKEVPLGTCALCSVLHCKALRQAKRQARLISLSAALNVSAVLGFGRGTIPLCSVAPQHKSGLGTPKVLVYATLACLEFVAPKCSLFDHAAVCVDLEE